MEKIEHFQKNKRFRIENIKRFKKSILNSAKSKIEIFNSKIEIEQ